MRIAGTLLAIAAAVFFMGCAGPENKLGRGLNNLTEFAHGGEMQRSMEQTALWDGPSTMPATGFFRGLTRSFARTGIGIYEVVTFPFPPYDPLLVPKHKLYPDPSIKTEKYPWGGLVLPEKRVYPASYEPGLLGDSFLNTDASIGFSGGEVAPFVPGSRFRALDP